MKKDIEKLRKSVDVIKRDVVGSEFQECGARSYEIITRDHEEREGKINIGAKHNMAREKEVEIKTKQC